MTARAASRGEEALLAAALLTPDLPAPAAVADPRRFAVYRNNVVVSLVDAIGATFPAVESLVGEEFFRAAAREFVLGHPPASPVLLDYGGEFPDWLAAFPPAAGVPYLGDVARIEWCRSRAYNAADAEPFDKSGLADTPPERLLASRVVPHPSLSLVASPFPAASLWAQATGRTPTTDLDLASAETALIVRPRDVVDVRAISPAMRRFLLALIEGETIGEAAEPLNEDADLIAECLGGIFQLDLVTRLETPEFDADGTAHQRSTG